MENTATPKPPQVLRSARITLNYAAAADWLASFDEPVEIDNPTEALVDRWATRTVVAADGFDHPAPRPLRFTVPAELFGHDADGFVDLDPCTVLVDIPDLGVWEAVVLDVDEATAWFELRNPRPIAAPGRLLHTCGDWTGGPLDLGCAACVADYAVALDEAGDHEGATELLDRLATLEATR